MASSVSADLSAAMVQQIFLDEVTPNLLLSVLQMLEKSPSPSTHSISRDHAKLCLESAG